MSENTTISSLLKELNVQNMKELEQTRFHQCQRLFAEVVKEDLETIDARLAEERDKGRYRHKGKRPLQFQTMMGFVEVDRNLYLDCEKETYIYLLDSFLQLESAHGFSPMVEEFALDLAVSSPSYRSAVETLDQVLGYRVMSHETLRQMVLQATQSPKTAPEASRRVLFIEVDGLYVKYQRQRTRGTELKFAAIHEGWTTVGKRTRLVHKRHYQHTTKGQSFWEGLDDFLMETYGYDPQTTTLCINGDGASWITVCQDHYGDQAIFTLDRYHVSRDLRALLHDHPLYRKIYKAYSTYDVEMLLVLLNSVIGTLENEKQEERLETLVTHLTANQSGLKDYRRTLRGRGIDTTGMRPMGSAESTMRVMGRRVKHGHAWSPAGVIAMTNLKIAKLDGLTILSRGLGQEPEPRAITLPPLSNFLKNSKTPSKGQDQRGNIPYLDQSSRPVHAALKGLRGA